MASSGEEPATLLSRARGCMLGIMVGDALGMPVEGWPQSEIRALAQKTFGTDFVQDFIRGVPMGTFVPAGEPGQYRAARGAKDASFVPTGPASNAAVDEQCGRRAMYTDDTCACLGVGASIARLGRVDAADVARSTAELFRDNEYFRGCPPTAKKVMEATLQGTSVEQTGLPPIFGFPGGSFANGGGMRISLLSIAYRNASAAVLREAVTNAAKASHRHPEAVDFAVVQAAAVQHMLQGESPAAFDPLALLDDLVTRCQTAAMQRVVNATRSALERATKTDLDELVELDAICKLEQRPGSGFGFQIASVHMAPCVLWCACRYFRDPRRAVQAAIDIGGDTDTTASMVGAIVGALHGEDWCQDWAAQLENGEHGRDYALALAERLASLDVQA